MRMVAAASAILAVAGILAAVAPRMARGARAATPRVTRDARAASAERPCELSTLAPFVDQGAGKEARSVADIVDVSCESVYAGQKVRLSAIELYNRCEKKLAWSVPSPYAPPVRHDAFYVTLDEDATATAVFWAGPGCAPGESLIAAHLEAAPYATVTTTFTILPPQETEAGMTALPNSAVESTNRSAATVLELEFPASDAGKYVSVTAPALQRRCGAGPKVVWVGAGARLLTAGKESVDKVQLDGNGNAFVAVLAGASCEPGESVILATLEEPPYTEYTTSFTLLPPTSG
jgi:hypothetical protein